LHLDAPKQTDPRQIFLAMSEKYEVGLERV
jgi:hypothetical protein